MPSDTIGAETAVNMPADVRNQQVELIGVRKEFGAKIVAVEDADLTVSDGEHFRSWIFGNLFRPNQAPVINVVAAALTVVAIIPVWLAQRLGGDPATTKV